jgi:hypothetical protein
MNIRKPLGLFIGLLAMAFAALPAVAGAAELTNSEGVPVEPGATVSGTSTDAITETEFGPLVCEHVEVHGIVEVNSGGKVEVVMDEAGGDSAGGCTFMGKSAVVEPTLNSIDLSGSSGTANFQFLVNGAPESSVSSVTWNSPATSIHVQGAVKGAIAGEFSGNFALFDSIGEPLTLHE